MQLLKLLTHCEDHFIHFVINPQFICLHVFVTSKKKRSFHYSRRLGIRRTYSEETANSIQEAMKQLLPCYPPGEKEISEVK